MRILVVGGTGIIGHSFCTSLLGAGHDVTIVSDGKGLFNDEVADLQSTHIIVDRNDAKELSRCFDTHATGCWDLVFDVCCYNAKQAEYIHTILRGKVGHYIALSTILCFRDSGSLPISPCSPAVDRKRADRYVRNKLDAESYLLEANNKDEFPVTILRLPHVLGRGCDLGAIPLHNRDVHLLGRIRRGLPMLLVNGGSQLIQIVCTRDISESVLRLVGITKSMGRFLIVANPQVIPARHYYELIAESLDKPLHIEDVPATILMESEWGWKRTAHSRIYDLRSTYEIVGAIPATSIADAIQECVQYHVARPTELEFRDYFADLAPTIYSATRDWAKRLNTCALARERTAVDRRMNDFARTDELT